MVKVEKYPQECLRIWASKKMSRVKKYIGKISGRNFLANVEKGSEVMMQYPENGYSTKKM